MTLILSNDDVGKLGQINTMWKTLSLMIQRP